MLLRSRIGGMPRLSSCYLLFLSVQYILQSFMVQDSVLLEYILFDRGSLVEVIPFSLKKYYYLIYIYFKYPQN